MALATDDLDAHLHTITDRSQLCFQRLAQCTDITFQLLFGHECAKTKWQRSRFFENVLDYGRVSERVNAVHHHRVACEVTDQQRNASPVEPLYCCAGNSMERLGQAVEGFR